MAKPKPAKKRGFFSSGPKPCGVCRKTTSCKCSGTKKKVNEQISLFAPAVSVKSNSGKGSLPACGNCGAFLYPNGRCRNVTCKHH